MWIYNSDFDKWYDANDSLLKSEFDFLKKELSSTRFYSKHLSGATFLPINNLDDIYDILGEWEPRNWYISTLDSPYIYTDSPSKYPTNIDSSSSYDYYTKFISEYGMTLKNLFTSDRLIKDSVNNYLYIDVATTEYIDLSLEYVDLFIDGIKLKTGHKVLVKDQKTQEALLSSVDPDTYFLGNYTIVQNLGATIDYEYYNNENGIYLYDGKNLIKQTDLDDYKNCIRYSLYVNLGSINVNKQFHLNRLLNGFFPTSLNSEPMEFKEKHNWLLRNKVDYNNLFEINYYDVLKHSDYSYFLGGITYSIPERTISVGEFGVILNTQGGISSIIPNKYKVNLRGLSHTSEYYWICGDDNTLLRVRKFDFLIDRIKLDTIYNLTSVSFLNDLRGVVVGENNTILLSNNSGLIWNKLEIPDFSLYNYNKVLFSDLNTFYIVGKNGVFIEMFEDINGWTAYKRRISKNIDSDDEYLLVDDINDICKTKIDTWGLSYSFSGESTAISKNILMLAADNNNLISYDIDSSTNFDFIYFDFGKNYGDLRNITRREDTNDFYFTGSEGLYKFDISNFQYIGIGNSYSNTIAGTYAILKTSLYSNEIFDYNGDEILLCGNNSLLKSSTYSVSYELLDVDFESRLKSKLLFLDYDMGSKLNFFTDQGDYRLPTSVTFSNTAFTASGYNLGFSSIIYGATSPSYATQSENNWLTYWIDSQKTFEFYSNSPLDESSKVLISSTFSYSTDNNITLSNIITNDAQISYLAPRILETMTASRYNGYGYTSIVEPFIPDASNSLYLSDYLMILKVSSSYSANVGDVMRLESNIVDSNFIINKIFATNSSAYLYMYSEFNGNIITELSNITDFSTITFKNLNRYNSTSQLVEKFNLHPVGNAYKIEESSSVLKIDPKFNTLTSYYNLATNVILNGDYSTMSYTDGFLKFGYTPTYNLLDYLEGINKKDSLNPSFYADKEYLAMPVYKNIPLGTLTASNIYIDSNGLTASGTTGNKLTFGPDLKLEWESIFINTFVDVELYQPTKGTYSTERLLVMNKHKVANYDNLGIEAYVIEFHKNINFEINYTLNSGVINISSRRSLSKISSDLQELNNIQKISGSNTEIYTGFNYKNYNGELNFKIPTDSYAKVLTSDVDTVSELSAIMYVDNKNELSMNITRLDRNYNIPITNTGNYNNKLYIQCSAKHDLSKGDGVVLEFNGGSQSSEFLNQQYFGYHVVTLTANEYDFIVEIDYGQDVFIGNDTGFVKYIKKDPFLNYQPVDIIDVGVDKKGKRSVMLDIDNLILKDNKFSLENVDFSNYRFRLVDGLNIETISLLYPWILEAEISDAVLGLDSNGLVWYKGTWEAGRWFGGRWVSGTWKAGDWYGGIWDSKKVKDNFISVDIEEKNDDISQSIWLNGRWYDGTWNNGTWNNGRRYAGIWNAGIWKNGIWNNGTWNNGEFIGGIWVDGVWNSGIFNCNSGPSYWIDGEWFSGDFENGMWYNGLFSENKGVSRFGTKSFNSRTATWQAGDWQAGSFFSKLDDTVGVSAIHKYSIWKTGNWASGNFYGGIAYNINFQSGVWHGGVLEEIEVIGFNSINNSIIINGLFKFNLGDVIYLLNENLDQENYSILKVVEDEENKSTELYVNYNIPSFIYNGIVSTSGIFDLTDTINSLSVSDSISSDIFSTVIDSAIISEIKVKLNITHNNIEDLIINLKSPNGSVINLKNLGSGGTSDNLENTIFTTSATASSFVSGSSPYSDVFQMEKALGVGSIGYVSNTSILSDLMPSISDREGLWELYVRDNTSNAEEGVLLDWELEIVFDKTYIDTNIRVVSDFKNVNWKSGIWTNGIYENGLFESGIWFNGVFNGIWG